jgi:menaquinone-dependent protoporphyrinogen oxidase
MNVLIAYTSKTGTTAECVARLQRQLNGMDVTAVQIDRETPDLDAYDILVFGAPVRFGKLPKAVRQFLKENEKKRSGMPHALFLCCGLAHEYEYYIEHLYSDELRSSAFLIESFGGTLDYKGQSFFEKLLIHAIRSSIRENEIEDGDYTPEMPSILPESIGKMATYVRLEAEKLKKR